MIHPTPFTSSAGAMIPYGSRDGLSPEAIFEGIEGADGVMERLKTYCDNHCPGLSQKKMFSCIRAGKELEACFADPHLSKSSLFHQATPKAATHLMWWLMAKAAVHNELYVQGVFRLDDPDLLLFNFLKLCGHGKTYRRTSSHMHEATQGSKRRFGKEIAGQYGLDIQEESGSLPANMGTILFMVLPDSTLFIKLEEHGMPPFWKRRHLSRQSMGLHIQHHLDYFFPEKRQDQGLDCGIQRKEHFPRALKERYLEVLSEVYGHAFKRDVFGRPQHPKAMISLYEEGAKFGLSRTHYLLTEKLGRHTSVKKTQLVQELAERIQQVRARGYKGDLKGREVALAQFGSR